MTRHYEMGAPHPIHLEKVDFVRTRYQRINFGDSENLNIPAITVEVHDPHINLEQLYGSLLVKIRTKDTKSKLNPNSFKLELDVFVFYRCVKFSQSEKALSDFMNSDAAVLIIFPYARAYISDIVARSGLPDLHLPLAQIRTSVQEK